VENGSTLGQETSAITLYPQVLINVEARARFDIASRPGIQQAVARAEHDLAGAGRVLLRASGTEPVIRVMVEGKSRPKVKRLAETIAKAVRKAV
jgi:phosphoglucosamine mutase